MAHSEACQLFIEQQIKEGLDQGKTPSSIGKELAALAEKWFEASIPADTLRKRAERMAEKLRTNVHTSTNHCNHTEISENQVSPHGGAREGAGRPGKYEKTEINVPMTPSEIQEKPSLQPVRNNKGQLEARTVSGPAKPTKCAKPPEPYSDAVHWATVAISQLSRIRDEDPKREVALGKVKNWVDEQLGRRKS